MSKYCYYSHLQMKKLRLTEKLSDLPGQWDNYNKWLRQTRRNLYVLGICCQQGNKAALWFFLMPLNHFLLLQLQSSPFIRNFWINLSNLRENYIKWNSILKPSEFVSGPLLLLSIDLFYEVKVRVVYVLLLKKRAWGALLFTWHDDSGANECYVTPFPPPTRCGLEKRAWVWPPRMSWLWPLGEERLHLMEGRASAKAQSGAIQGNG